MYTLQRRSRDRREPCRIGAIAREHASAAPSYRMRTPTAALGSDGLIPEAVVTDMPSLTRVPRRFKNAAAILRHGRNVKQGFFFGYRRRCHPAGPTVLLADHGESAGGSVASAAPGFWQRSDDQAAMRFQNQDVVDNCTRSSRSIAPRSSRFAGLGLRRTAPRSGLDVAAGCQEGTVRIWISGRVVSARCPLRDRPRVEMVNPDIRVYCAGL